MDFSHFNGSLLYMYTNIKNDDGFYPIVIGFERCHKSKEKIHWTKSVYALHFVLDGKGKFINTTVKKGDCFLVCPDHNITYGPNINDPYSYFWIEFTGFLANKFIENSGFSPSKGILSFHLNCMDKIIEIFKTIKTNIEQLSNEMAQAMEYESILLKIFSLISEEKGFSHIENKKTNQEIKMDKLLQFINTNYSNPDLDVEVLSKQFFYIPSYITRIMKKYTGMGPNKYINKIRMEKALTLLETKTYTIEQISSAIGYKSQFYFSRKFKQYYGYPPSQYNIDK